MTFTEIYNRYQQEVFSYSLFLSKDVDDAKDIAQYVWIKVFKKLHTLDDFSKIYSWLMRVTRNTSINFLKKKTNLKSDELKDSYLITYQPNTFDLDQMQKVINSLPIGYRTVFMLKIKGYKHNEISEIVGMSPSTSKTQFLRAKKILQKKFTENIY